MASPPRPFGRAKLAIALRPPAGGDSPVSLEAAPSRGATSGTCTVAPAAPSTRVRPSFQPAFRSRVRLGRTARTLFRVALASLGTVARSTQPRLRTSEPRLRTSEDRALVRLRARRMSRDTRPGVREWLARTAPCTRTIAVSAVKPPATSALLNDQ